MTILDKFKNLDLSIQSVILAGIFGIFTAIIVPLASWVHGSVTAGDLMLVDARFTANDTISIRLRNTGAETAFFKEAKVSVKKIWVLIPDGMPSGASVSTAEYELRIPMVSYPYSKNYFVSQEIQPNKTDEFQLKIESYLPQRKDLVTLIKQNNIPFPEDEINASTADYVQFVVSMNISLSYNELSDELGLGKFIWAKSIVGNNYEVSYIETVFEAESEDEPKWLHIVKQRNRDQLAALTEETGLKNPAAIQLSELSLESLKDKGYVNPFDPPTLPSQSADTSSLLTKLEKRVERLEKKLTELVNGLPLRAKFKKSS